jgi:DNA-binding MarR family transcriptional regulator
MWSRISCQTDDVTKRPAPEEADLLVDRLLDVTHRVQQVVSDVAERYDLTPQQVALLRMLDEPMSMGAYAEDLSCDPSNVTGLIDRAERLGLVERLPDPFDRRVRMLTLTAKGRSTRSRVNRDLASGLADTLGLATSDASRIAGLLQSMTNLTVGQNGQ